MGFRYEEKGVEAGSSSMVAPEGVYNLVITSASDTKDGLPRVTKNGDDYVNVALEIDDANEWLGTKVYHNVTFMKNGSDGKPRKGAGIALHFLKCIGEPWEVPFDVNPDNWIGKRLRAKLIASKDLKGRPKNEIAYLIEDSQVGSDSVPF